jgi:hypothetical protein
MTRYLHPVAGIIAFLTVVVFAASTVTVELFGSKPAIIWVKTAIPWGFLVLIPALIATNASGFKRAGRRKDAVVARKKRRAIVITLNGFCVLIPAALFLAVQARAGQFDMLFYAIQAVELLAGAVNITLLGLNIVDGARMSGRLTKTDGATPA